MLKASTSALLLIERIERDYLLERAAAHKEYEEKKVELRENLISDLEEKKRMIEAERSCMELTSDKSSLQVADHAIARRLILEGTSKEYSMLFINHYYD
ncbi:hypothetical protein TNCV_3220641 [Trichonephila clavipes]|nr:hypothetical protein TNCV_3220641 [Trichonephila clavipes]